jgi:hypothetical protein
VSTRTVRCVAREWTEGEWENILEQLRTDGTVEAEGVFLDAPSVKRLLAAAPRVNGKPHFTMASFARTTFGDEASFDGATFGDQVRFSEATFGDRASFVEATFGEVTFFDGATFGERADFRWTTFGERAIFAGATFGKEAAFGRAAFGNGAYFGGATFGDGAFFRGTFGDRVSFDGATFGDRVRFSEASFGKFTVFTAVLVTGHLVLNGEFGEASRLDLTAQAVRARLSLPAGGTIRARWAKVNLEESAFPQPTILAPLPETSCCPAEAIALALSPRSENYLARPSVMSLRWANLAGLVIGENVSLAGCQFQGAHNLDKVRFEGRTEFARAPSRFGGRGRQALAEEHRWRAAVRKENGWFAAPEWAADPPEPLRSATIATLYRGLRKGREDSKDEPGAADFYYGEMEMRRFSTRWRAERLMLTVYWLSCGYALRARRAFACLAALLVVGALLFTTVGFDQSPVPVTRPDRLTPSGDLHYTTVMTPPPSHTLIDGLEFAVDTSTSLLHTRSDRPLTGSGRVTELGLRYAGPLLLGLALLSLRGRVKR